MVKVNMMCGVRNFGPDWINIDGGRHSHLDDDDIYLTSQFPGSIDLIYCSHGIAYFDREEVKKLIGSWYYRLRPGGVLRLATPNWNELKNFDLDQVKGPLYGEMNMGLNDDIFLTPKKIFHKTCYDYESLKSLLLSLGFIDICPYDHRTTEHPNTGDRADKYDDCSSAYISGTLISLNVECIKPL